jgi:uncharacterized membrane protein (UPF0127 family)
VSRRARRTLAVAVAVISAIGIVVLVVQFASRGNNSAHPPIGLRTRPAGTPFGGFRETRIDLDGRCRQVAVADTASLREQGLRGHVDLGTYGGMLFVFGGDTDAAFTMAGVTAPLEIGWYSADGKRVDGAHMAPCPNRGQGNCPVYASGRKYRVALERPRGSQSVGQLTPCA